MSKQTALQHISPDKIIKNPDNPRLIFREEQMNELLASIKEVGIKVPISVFGDGTKFTILDGERRWRCAKKLNLEQVPAIVQPKPTKLENLLMMFNIHNVRVEWDLMPMALKLGEIRDMITKEGKDTSAKSLAAVTGVRLPTVRRALDLLDLPQKYQRMLLREAEKPQNEQRITPDLFIEVYKSLHVVEKHTPQVFDKVTKPAYVDALVTKYSNEVINNVVGYRDIAKIARAELAGVDKKAAVPAILKLVTDKNYSIENAYKDTVESAYAQRDLLSKVDSLTGRLTTFGKKHALTAETVTALKNLRKQIDRLLENAK